MTNECLQLAGLKDESAVTHKDTRISKIKRDEKMGQNVCDVLQDIKSPFETSTELFNISCGVVADKAVTACEKFVEKRPIKGIIEFFDPITKNN